MCDIIVALPSNTIERTLLFGKNSDRQRNEAQTVEFFPRAQHPLGSSVTCTYLTIPQKERTYAVLLCRPFWIWGAEMGANEHGVVIGNEGLYARNGVPEEKALIGMDLLRLALERADSAKAAADVITELLERYGQGGNGGHLTASYYHNSFIIADPGEALVLETNGREWLMEHVRGVRALSNEYSIGQQADRTSGGLAHLLRDFGWDGNGVPNYAEFLIDPQKTHIGSARQRWQCATTQLKARDGHLHVTDMIAILRDHTAPGQSEHDWSPATALKYGVCCHPGQPERGGQTTGAIVSELRVKDSVHWVTGTAAPCISIFKPVLMDVPLPVHGPRPTDRFDPGTLWWRHERLHRAAVLGNFQKFLADIRSERDALEAEFGVCVRSVLEGGSARDRAVVIAKCWNQAMQAEDRWYTRLDKPSSLADTSFVSTWQRFNQLAGVDWSDEAP